MVTVLFSGGQDSTTCLLWAMNEIGLNEPKSEIKLISFEYGQRHAVELVQAKRIQEMLGLTDIEYVSIEALRHFGAAALTNPKIDVEAEASADSENVWASTHGLPSTFVPGRNMIFLSLAAARSAQLGNLDLVTGVCQADNAGYPDCRDEFVNAMETAVGAALGDYSFTIHAPLLYRNKAETFELAHQMGALELIVEHTHTCYHGDRSHRFPWGYGCGECPSCRERADGFEKFTEVMA
jgi:7-cyano-7-deazaguanine synthase